MSVDTELLRMMAASFEASDLLKPNALANLRSAAAELDELRRWKVTAEAEWDRLIAERKEAETAHEATKRELETERARRESAEGLLDEWLGASTPFSLCVAHVAQETKDHFARFEVRTELEAAKAQIAELTKERDAARSAVRIAADARESLNAALEDLQSAHGLRCQLATAVEALESIASCTSYIDGDLVSIAREALAAIRAPETTPECTCAPVYASFGTGRLPDHNCPVHGAAGKDR